MAGARVKRQPQRTCIACRRVLTKRTLRRIVHTPADEVVVDPSGKLAGRGAYLCAYQDCWQKALKARLIGPALKATLSEADAARLLVYAQSLPERPVEEQSDQLPLAPVA
jgi:predicted RNA-binding protein YlxR (DUF448 family)